MKTWNIGAKIWFVFYVFVQWILFIEVITARNRPGNLISTFFITGFVMTVLILWLAFSHKREALYVLLGIAAVNAVMNLVNGGFEPMLRSLVLPGVNYLVARNGVE
ncbi:MAG: hypothetical protein J6J78_09755 [Clostridia bacterium]|nr:hypothetical protein [Clostridia bacterium]